MLTYSWIVWPQGTPVRAALEAALTSEGRTLPRHCAESNSSILNLSLRCGQPRAAGRCAPIRRRQSSRAARLTSRVQVASAGNEDARYGDHQRLRPTFAALELRRSLCNGPDPCWLVPEGHRPKCDRREDRFVRGVGLALGRTTDHVTRDLPVASGGSWPVSNVQAVHELRARTGHSLRTSPRDAARRRSG